MLRKVWGIVGSLVGVGCFFDPQTNSTDDAEASAGTTSTSNTPTTWGPSGPWGTSESSEPSTITDDVTTTADAVCGDFQIEGDEQCDNGFGNNGGGSICRDDCQLNVCGDNYVATFDEGCDDGNLTPGDGCSETCTLEGCGDGVTAGREQCDDGNNVDDDGCTNQCRLPICGDGVVNGTDECDDANQVNEDACTDSCRSAVCGDGFVQEGVESCDDGNATNDDECSNACVAASCGDGIVQLDEACDDANMVDEDACLSTCEQPSCGDGFVWAGMEVCDDAAPQGMGVCLMCKRSAYYVFVTSKKYNGEEVGSLADADAECTMLAAGKPIEGNYVAWLSDDDDAAMMRLFAASVPYVLPNLTKVADNWTDLTDGTLDAPINRTDAGTNIMGNGFNCGDFQTEEVWTGTAANGDAMAPNCFDWTESRGNGLAGVVNQMDVDWTQACTMTCDNSARLYCFEQP
jgi:cysteine-rich repeat protein